MGKHCRCATGICDNDIQYPEHKLPKDGAVRAAWVNALVKDGKQ